MLHYLLYTIEQGIEIIGALMGYGTTVYGKKKLTS